MKKIAIVATTAALTLSLGAFAGCAPTPVNDNNASKPAAKEISTETITTKTDDGKELVMYAATQLPVNHAGFDVSMCGTCHSSSQAEMPAMPENHESYGADMCAACHTADAKEPTPALPEDHANFDPSSCGSCHAVEPILAAAVPEDHYVNNSYSSGKFNNAHENCLACHAVDEAAVAAAKEAAEKAAAEKAEAEKAAAEDGDAPAEVDAPDCAPCHGDAHKPGEENPHGYPTAAGADADDDKAAADDKATTTTNKSTSSTTAKDDDAEDTKSSSTSSSNSSTSSASSASSSSSNKTSSSSSSTKASSDAPDCASCHGDAHKPGDENPHGY